MEPLLDKAAAELGIDQLAIRSINAPDSNSLYGGGQVPVTSAHLGEALAQGAERFGWEERRARSGRRQGSRVTGVGIGQAYHGAGNSGQDGLLRIAPDVAPTPVAVLPLSRNERLVPTARRVWEQLRPHFRTQYDDSQSIGRRYRRQDEVGTPLCVTVDFETLDDEAVTIRERDTMSQIRVPLDGVVEALRERIEALRPAVEEAGDE